MLKELRFQALSIPRRDFALVFILLFNTVIWYFMSLMWTNRLVSDAKFAYLEPLVLTVYNAAIILAGIAGSIFLSKFSRTKFLFSWMLFGALASLSLALFDASGTTQIVILTAILGTSFGIGLPSCFSYFSDNTAIDNRGTIAGIILLISNLSAIPVAVLFATLSLNLVAISVVSGFWRLVGLVFFVSLKPREVKPSAANEKTSVAPVLGSRGFLLYLLPWLMFSLVNGLEEPIVSHSLGSDLSQMMTMVAPLIGGISAFIAGFFADRTGRKRVVVVGFVTLGLAYAVLGLASQVAIAQYLYVLADALSGGIFLALFFLVLWGDLSNTASKEKYYAFGTAFNYLTFIIRQISIPYVEFVPASAAFSLAAFFLFLAVLPLMYAPETVPESKIRLTQLKNYVERAKRLGEKYPKKGNVD